MSQVVIENFRHGLDARRSNLTSVLGTLQLIKNGHINQGGEIEQRKSFVPISIAPTVASNVSATFGMDALADSIVIFGGDRNDDIAHWPPTGFTYQQLVRWPAANAVSGGTCNVAGTPNYCSNCEDFSNPVKATGIIYSCVYGGKAFVLATMADGLINAFYDGVAIGDINYFGRLLANMDDATSTLRMYCMITMMVNRTDGYTADIQVTGGSPTGVTVTGPHGRDFTTRFEATLLCNGVPHASFGSTPLNDVPGKNSTGHFEIQDGSTHATMGTADNTIVSVKAGTTQLLPTGASPTYSTTPVPYNVDSSTTAADVATAINTNSSGTGVTAKNINNQIYLTAIATGTTYNNKNIEVVVVGRVIINRCFIRFAGGTGLTLTDIKVNGKTILTAFGGVFPTAGETLSAFVARLADNILNNAATNGGYIAMARDTTLKIGKVISQSNIAPTSTDDHPISNVLVVQVDWSAGDVTITDPTLTGVEMLDVTITPQSMLLYQYSNDNGILSFRSRDFSQEGLTGQISSAVFGGVPPYRYQWRVVSQTLMNIAFETGTSKSTAFTSQPGLDAVSLQQVVAQMKAVVVLDVFDSNGARGTSTEAAISIAYQANPGTGVVTSVG